MPWLIYLFGGGLAFFVGAALLLVALASFAASPRRGVKALASLAAFLGLAFVALSATPLPYWLYGVLGLVALVWLAAERGKRGWLFDRRRWFRAALVVVVLAVVALETPYHLTPTVPAAGRPTLYVVADSITAGMGGEKATWPRLLADGHGVPIVDLSRPGATARSALRQAEGIPEDGGLVLLEIGGNDLLGTTTAADFAADLDRLLERVCRSGRTVVLFELPLPPFCNDFGHAQRRLAARYGVVLVPKRRFAAVLTGDGATVDSLHLSASGHERMADLVWELIRPAYAE